MTRQKRVKRVLVGALEQFPTGSFTVMSVDGVDLGILRTGARVLALRNHCPHRGAPICRGQVGGTMMPSDPGVMRYDMDPEVLSCPWHGYEFDLRSGECLFGAIRGRLQRFDAGVSDGLVWVDVRQYGRDSCNAGEEERQEAAKA